MISDIYITQWGELASVRNSKMMRACHCAYKPGCCFEPVLGQSARPCIWLLLTHAGPGRSARPCIWLLSICADLQGWGSVTSFPVPTYMLNCSSINRGPSHTSVFSFALVQLRITQNEAVGKSN